MAKLCSVRCALTLDLYDDMLYMESHLLESKNCGVSDVIWHWNATMRKSLRHLNRIHREFSSLSVPVVGLYGICEDRNSSFMRGPAKAPRLIREHLLSPSSNTFCEQGLDIATCFTDFGDKIAVNRTLPAIYSALEPVISTVHAQRLIPVGLGGDHSVTSCILTAIRNNMTNPFVIVHFDAHPDLYEDFDGDFHSHASPFARIMETRSGHSILGSTVTPLPICSKLISIGIRTATAHQREQIARYGVQVIEARDFPSSRAELRAALSKLIGPQENVYISFDLDVLDPCFAPGVSHRESGGLSVRQAVDALHCIPGTVIGADLVEYNPDRDLDGITGSAAAKILKELMSVIMVSRGSGL